MNLVLSSSARDPERFPVSVPGQFSVVRQFLGLEREDDPGIRRVLDYELTDPAIDLLEAVRRDRAEGLLEGRCGAYFEVSASAEVGLALDLAEELEICVNLVGPGAVEDHEGRIARLAAEGPGVVLVVRPDRPGPETTRRRSSIVRAVEAGAGLRFAADDPESLRLLAGSLVADGLPRDVALRALATSPPPGLVHDEDDEDDGGPWREGAPADFVVWDGSPIDLSSRPLMVVVDGRIAP
jgi:hypothetical protein